jgi:hypothetical protein
MFPCLQLLSFFTSHLISTTTALLVLFSSSSHSTHPTSLPIAETCLEDSGFNPEFHNVPVSQLSGRPENLHGLADIPDNSFLGLETVVQSIHLHSSMDKILNQTCRVDSRLCLNQPVLNYKKEYGTKNGHVSIGIDVAYAKDVLQRS